MTRALLLVGVFGLACGGLDDVPEVAVAASTEEAVHAVFHDERNVVPVIVNANASSVLARQLRDHYPGDVFLSADTAWADEVARDRQVLDRVDLLTNTIVEVRHEGAARDCTALADPDHVPAGRYARQALVAADRWPPPDPVSFPTGPAAAWAVANGDCATGFVYGTDAAAADLQPVRTLDVRATYPLLLLHERGRWVYELLQSDDAAAVFARHGFGRP